ncbi:MAG TPA: TetR/AcrR family transcriptional regulator [Hyphomicrobiaceae bacterium]|nr:TetR/AcrR family transcriptional regulator [Hyphomicrobiaceae bacterium]
MGRRSSHTPQQLRALVLDAAQEIIETQGLSGLSARESARRIGYSPGTIYNIFANLDDVVLNVEARVLDALDERLGEAQQAAGNDATENAADRLVRIARAYLSFAQEKPRLWNLLLEHHMPPGAELPTWYGQKLEQLTTQIELALAPHFTPGSESERQRAARALWAGVHGIASLSTADKLTVVTRETAGALIDNLVGVYLAGLSRQGGEDSGNHGGPLPDRSAVP